MIKLQLNLIKTALFSFIALISVGSIQAQNLDSLAMRKLGHLAYPQWNLNDVWGYVDADSNEYALVGTNDGLDIVDVTDPSNPTSKLRLPGAFSVWRDIKTWDHYAYVCHDFQFSWSTLPNDGILIVDLDSLDSRRTKNIRPLFVENDGSIDSLQTAHNLYIDENGVMYVFGANINNGGVLMFDVATDPWNPVFLGEFDTYYQHDGFARGDTLYGSAVNNGLLTIVDVSNKSNPTLLATQITPNQFTHNCWLSDDGKTVYTTDELPGSFIAAYDITDLNNIEEVDRLRTLPGTNVTPHNAHVFGDYLVTSYYTRGVQIVDAKYPDLMVEVGWYDTSPFTGQAYSGNWGAYPYMPSGNILATDMQQGLFVCKADYTPASRVFVQLVDSVTKAPITGAEAELTLRNFKAISNIFGTVKVGVADQGNDAWQIIAAGYYPKVYNFQFTQGEYDTLRIPMLPITFGTDELEVSGVEIFPNPSQSYFDVVANNTPLDELMLHIYNLQGQLVYTKMNLDMRRTRINHHLPKGSYVIELTQGNRKHTSKLLVN